MQSNFSSALGGGGLLTAINLNPNMYKKASMPMATTSAGALAAGKKFETMYLSQMLQPMFEGIKSDKLFGGGDGENMFQSLAVDEYAKAISASGGVGIAQAVQREILQIQEQAHAPVRS